ncbi:MAG TPA: peptidoglycan-binding protein, partial [Kiloniellales bacterium]
MAWRGPGVADFRFRDFPLLSAGRMDYLPDHTPLSSLSNRVNVRSFLLFLGVIGVIGLVWAVIPIADRRARDHEQRMVASLDLVENGIAGSSTDILRVDLFSPKIAPLSGDGRWKLTGIMETQGRAGMAVDVHYVAVVAFSCTPYGNADCGKIESLSIEDQPLIVDGAVVAELQSVLDTSAETPPNSGDTGATAPVDATESSTMPAPQTESPLPPAASPEAAPAGEPATATTASSPPDSATSMATAPAVPAPDTEPVQGDRMIFLVQKRLKEMGYDPGPVDGKVGPRTTSAIQVYQ